MSPCLCTNGRVTPSLLCYYRISSCQCISKVFEHQHQRALERNPLQTSRHPDAQTNQFIEHSHGVGAQKHSRCMHASTAKTCTCAAMMHHSSTSRKKPVMWRIAATQDIHVLWKCSALCCAQFPPTCPDTHRLLQVLPIAILSCICLQPVLPKGPLRPRPAKGLFASQGGTLLHKTCISSGIATMLTVPSFPHPEHKYWIYFIYSQLSVFVRCAWMGLTMRGRW